MSVGDICTRDVVTVSRTDTVVQAARLMRAKGVGTVVVVEGAEDRRVPVGILTDRDIVVGVVARSPEHLDQLLIEDVVFQELLTIEEDASLWKALQRMRDRGIRRMPVIDDAGLLVGVVSMDDFVVYVAEQLGGLSKVIARQAEIDEEQD